MPPCHCTTECEYNLFICMFRTICGYTGNVNIISLFACFAPYVVIPGIRRFAIVLVSYLTCTFPLQNNMAACVMDTNQYRNFINNSCYYQTHFLHCLASIPTFWLAVKLIKPCLQHLLRGLSIYKIMYKKFV